LFKSDILLAAVYCDPV